MLCSYRLLLLLWHRSSRETLLPLSPRTMGHLKKKKFTYANDLLGVTTPNVKNRTLRNFDHSFEAAKGRRGLKEPLRRRAVACQV